MAGLPPSDSMHHGMSRSVQDSCYGKQEEPSDYGARWYFSRKEIEENSPSRKDEIDLKKENYLRKSYCTFLQDLGMRLKVPQVTIATAIVFCHRFFLRQSHAKNDRRTIATVCMFLAGKVEETPRPLKDVILVSYEIIHKKDPVAIQKIKQKEVCDQQKELILLGERVVLGTLGFDLNVQHPYKPLVEAIKKFKVAQNALAQVAWNFVNDGLRTSLCLQFKPDHIAAGAIFLAAKFLKVKLPSDGEKVWWQEFDVNPRQLEEVSNQMLELYEQNRTLQPLHVSEAEGNTGNHPSVTVPSSICENPVSGTNQSQAGGVGIMKQGSQVLPPSRPTGIQSLPDDRVAPDRSMQNQNTENGSADTKSDVWDQNMDTERKDELANGVEAHSFGRENMTEASSSYKSSFQKPVDHHLANKDESTPVKPGALNSSDFRYEAAKGSSHPDAIPKIDKDKVKAAMEKRKRLRNDAAKKTDMMDDDDLIERELESGIELAGDVEKTRHDERQSWPEPLKQQSCGRRNFELDQEETKDLRNGRISEQQLQHNRMKSRSLDAEERVYSECHADVKVENAEEGELSSLDDHDLPSPKRHQEAASLGNHQDHGYPHPAREILGPGRMNNAQKRTSEYDLSSQKPPLDKVASTGRQFEGKPLEFSHQRDMLGVNRMEYTEREQKRQRRDSWRPEE